MTLRSLPLCEVATFDPSPPTEELSQPLSTAAFVPMSSMSESGYVTVAAVRKSSELIKGYTYFQDGDVLVAKITPCFENGKIGQIQTTERHAFGSTEFHVVRASGKELNARYLHHFLRTEQVRSAGERRMTGSAGQRRVPKDFLKRLLIPLPEVSEQRRIAGILDQAEALRTKRRYSLTKLDDLNSAVFLDMFGSPTLNPKLWPLTPIAKIGRVITGNTPSREACVRLSSAPFSIIHHTYLGSLKNSHSSVLSLCLPKPKV